jgi:hypothetical protein
MAALHWLSEYLHASHGVPDVDSISMCNRQPGKELGIALWREVTT